MARMGSRLNGWVAFANDPNSVIDAVAGNGVNTGLSSAAAGTPDMTVIVAIGTAYVDGVKVEKTSPTIVSIDAADPDNPRKDIITINSSGVVAVTKGTPAAPAEDEETGPETYIPIPPDIPEGCVLLSEIWIEAAASALHGIDITDRRVEMHDYRTYVDDCVKLYHVIVTTCADDMTPSTTVLHIPDLEGFGSDDYFNGKYYIGIILNANSHGAAPEIEYRLASDFDSAGGLLTTAAFSQNVEASDVVIIMHEAVYRVLSCYLLLTDGTYGLSEIQALCSSINTFLTEDAAALLLLLDGKLDAVIGYVDEVESRLTDARAAYLDNINNANLASLVAHIPQSTGVATFDETSLAEQTIKEVALSARTSIGAIWLDMALVTQETTVRLYTKVDGTNYRKVFGYAFMPGDVVAINALACDIELSTLASNVTFYDDVKVTFQCGGGGVGVVNVPYAVV